MAWYSDVLKRSVSTWASWSTHSLINNETERKETEKEQGSTYWLRDQRVLTSWFVYHASHSLRHCVYRSQYTSEEDESLFYYSESQNVEVPSKWHASTSLTWTEKWTNQSVKSFTLVHSLKWTNYTCLNDTLDPEVISCASGRSRIKVVCLGLLGLQGVHVAGK